jgi:UDP-N-acetylmuramoylalanine--D-glutamate ligase
VRFSDLEGARVGVWGAGREVRSFAEQLTRRLPRARIVAAAFDAPPPADVLELLCSPEARAAVGADALAALEGCELVVRSPGVTIHRPELQALAAAGVPVTTATSLWLAERRGERVLGVTGTKGKSTTAALAHHLIRAGGHAVRLAGNIGSPALDLLDEPAALAVVELSSYQIADLATAPEVALVTNLFAEHLDWHLTEEAYRREKLRLLELPGIRAAVLNGRAQPLAGISPPYPVIRFGVPSGWDLLDGGIALRGEVAIERAALPLPGDHNALNLCGALTAVEALGLELPRLPAALAGFEPLAHRLQTVAETGNVLWVDDSISTTPESALAALASFPGRPLVLIGGGQDRGQDFGTLALELAARGAAVVGVPSNGGRLVAAARAAGIGAPRAVEAPDMAAAVAAARALAPPGGVVLLSPAAPSFDSYRDFEQRAERFREAVLLGEGVPDGAPS